MIRTEIERNFLNLIKNSYKNPTQAENGKLKNNNKRKKEKTNNKMVDLNPSISIITLNVSGQNIPVKNTEIITMD